MTGERGSDSPAGARLLALAAAALFSTGGAAIKWNDFDGAQVAGLRSAFATVTILAVAPQARRGWTWRALPVGAAYAATMVLFVLSNKLTTSASTIFLQSTAPLYLLLLSPWLLREPIRRRDVGFMAALAVGMAAFFLGREAPSATARDPLLGNVLGAASGVSWALTIAGLRWLSRGDPPGRNSALPATVLGNALAFAVTLPFAWPLPDVPAQSWAVVVFLGVFQIAFAYLCLTAAARSVPAFELSLLLLLEPVLNPVWSWLVHGETVGTWSLAGAALILVATIVHSGRVRVSRAAS